MIEPEDSSPLPGYFQELQQEKNKLESKLDQLKIRKKDIEAKQDNVSKKNLQLNQKNDNMSRTVDVAKRKCEETQIHVDKLQKMNDDLQQNIQQTKGKIKGEEKKKDSLIKDYEGRYVKLGEKFRNGMKHYVDLVLSEEENKRKASCVEKMCQVDTKKEVVELMSLQLKEMKVSTAPDEKPAKSGWCEVLESKDMMISLLSEERGCAHEVEEKLNASISDVTKCLEESNLKLKHLSCVN